MTNKTKLLSKLHELHELALMAHYSCDEDPWYSCPKSADGCSNSEEGDDCTCGADLHNSKVQDLFNELLQTLES